MCGINVRWRSLFVYSLVRLISFTNRHLMELFLFFFLVLPQKGSVYLIVHFWTMASLRPFHADSSMGVGDGRHFLAPAFIVGGNSGDGGVMG